MSSESSESSESSGPSEPVRACIVGAGRMGRALAARLGGVHELTVLSRRAEQLSIAGHDVSVSDDPRVVDGCGVVLLAVPAGQIPAALGWVAPYVSPGALTVNLATELATRDVVAPPGVRLVGCKIVGQSGQVARGVPAALVVEDADPAERARLARVLAPVGVPVELPADTGGSGGSGGTGDAGGIARRVNESVARRMASAYAELERDLGELGAPEAVRSAALGNLAPGIWQALANGTAGPFLREIVRQLGEQRSRSD